ncbi:metal-dependent hydrolase [Vibrio tetraodonis]|uniref:metal-dependent hydrolase n=1 Tax=Vibrio tetraodonis TaxID=2231647 RepID=UPI000E09E7C4|nr:metal-dependent hydrolase [Vibrio tetraodonis]
MDPLTQGLLGASLPQAASKKQHLVVAGLLGLLSGMAPDLDTLIRSSQDALLYLEFHRQFTHSLLFIPIGSLICALVLHPIIARKRGLSFQQTWLYCALGYGTHGLLDFCTSYGTQLFWPLSNERYAWNTISIIDPTFTLPILALLILTLVKTNSWFARLAVFWALLYPVFGLMQKERAEDVGWHVAKQRGHEPLRLEAKPSFANILVWKIVYETSEEYFVDAVRVGKSTQVYPGESTLKLNIERDFPWLSLQSQQAKDIERFRWFSQGFIAQDPNNPLRIIDVRYSILPNQLKALWSIKLSPSASVDEHVKFNTHRDSDPSTRKAFLKMLLGS